MWLRTQNFHWLVFLWMGKRKWVAWIQPVWILDNNGFWHVHHADANVPANAEVWHWSSRRVMKASSSVTASLTAVTSRCLSQRTWRNWTNKDVKKNITYRTGNVFFVHLFVCFHKSGFLLGRLVNHVLLIWLWESSFVKLSFSNNLLLICLLNSHF